MARPTVTEKDHMQQELAGRPQDGHAVHDRLRREAEDEARRSAEAFADSNERRLRPVEHEQRDMAAREWR